jgi:serine/threonine protein kinase
MELNFGAPTDVPGDETDSGGSSGVKAPTEACLSQAEVARRFPQLEILECLGRGGMGIVYKARQARLNRLVALKILPPEKERQAHFSERFSREAQTLARLNHPSIVAVYDFGETDGLYYLLMEFVDGVSLRDLLRSHKLTPEEALAIVPKICEALQYAHDRGVVHRDIKPENILLDRDGQVKIADFGIAKIVHRDTGQQTLTQDRQVIGTPHYMAPEQVEHPQCVDHRADIYSLGVVFYEMLTGELPLGKFAPPSQKAAVDVRLDEVVLGALEKEPDRRYQQASEVKNDVETIATTPRQPQSELAPDPSTNLPGTESVHPLPSTSLQSSWITAARWTARVLGTLMLAGFVAILMVEGSVPLDRLGRHGQIASFAWGLALLGFVLGWKFEGTAALLIAVGWACFPIAQGLQPRPFLAPLPFHAIVAGLYAFCWWTTHGRKTRVLAGTVTGIMALLASSFLLAPIFTAQRKAPSRLTAEMNIPSRDPQAGPELIDLGAFYNAALSENWNDPFDRENHLGEVPAGVQTLAETRFDVRGVVQVEQQSRRFPARIDGIAIGQTCRRLHFLHAASNAALIEDGTQIGQYVVHLANGEQRDIPIVLGRDLLDWWNQPREGQPIVIAWEGDNPKSRLHADGRKLRLFKSTWENPFTEVEVDVVDFVATRPGPSPFLVALTAE